MKQGEIFVVFTADKASLDKAISQVEGDLKKVDRQATATSANINNSFVSSVGDMVQKTGSQFYEFGKKLASIAWNTVKVGALAAAGGIVALGIAGIKSASDLQAMQISMNGLTGSMELGAQAMATAYKYAQKAPFQLPEVAGTTKNLIAMGVQTDKIAEYLDTLGGVSITSGARLQDVGRIFGQVFATGKLQLEDLNQLTDNGIGIQKALEKQFGKTGEQIRQMATDGQISFKDFNKAMSSLVDPKILEQLENTLPRQIDRLKGSVRILSNAFVGVGVDATNGLVMAGDGMAQLAINVTRNIANFLRDPAITDGFNKVGTSIAKLATSLIDSVDWGAFKSRAANALNGISGFLDRLNEATKKGGIKGFFTELAKEINDGANKIDWAGTSDKMINGLLKALSKIDFKKYSGTFSNIVLQLIEGADWVNTTAKAVPILVKAFGDIISGAILGLIQWAIKDPLGFAFTLITTLFAPGRLLKPLTAVLGKTPLAGPVLEWIGNAINALGAPMRGKIGQFIDNIIGKLSELGGKIGASVGGAFDNAITAIGAKIAPVVTKVGEFLMNLLRPIGELGSRIWSHVSSAFQMFIDAIGSRIGGAAGKAGELRDSVLNVFKGIGDWLVSSGRALIDGFANGIKAAAGNAKQSAEEVLKKIRNLFPHSPAKEGPFSGSGWTLYSGAALMQGFSKGINQELGSTYRTMLNAMSQLAGVTAPSYALSGGYSVSGSDAGSDSGDSGAGSRSFTQVNNIYEQVDLDKANRELAYKVNL